MPRSKAATVAMDYGYDDDDDSFLVVDDEEEEEDTDFDDDDENMAPVRAPAKKGATAKSSKKKTVLGESNADNTPLVGGASSKNKKTIEEIYQKKSQLEHILLRPDTYSEC